MFSFPTWPAREFFNEPNEINELTQLTIIMNVLGIETSCDETSAAVVKDGVNLRSNVVSSSVNFHKKYGGIVPEIAFRKQLETITEVVDCALSEARTDLSGIDLISVTDGPGLLGSLLVGISFAKALSFSRNIPVIGVNHLYSHIYAGFLNSQPAVFPFVALVVSGGHTSLYYARGWDKISLIGCTQDDACGEAFDKTAKILNLGYPGGPAIEKFAKSGSFEKIKFSCSNTQKPLDFSFSGIKTAVLYYARKKPALCQTFQPVPRGAAHSFLSPEKPGLLSDKKTIADICAAFQEAALNKLVEKSFLACEQKNVLTLVIGGGVAANSALRSKFYSRAGNGKLKIIFPEKEFCMDNAAMVAGLGYRLFKKNKKRNNQ